MLAAVTLSFLLPLLPLASLLTVAGDAGLGWEERCVPLNVASATTVAQRLCIFQYKKKVVRTYSRSV